MAHNFTRNIRSVLYEYTWNGKTREVVVGRGGEMEEGAEFDFPQPPQKGVTWLNASRPGLLGPDSAPHNSQQTHNDRVNEA